MKQCNHIENVREYKLNEIQLRRLVADGIFAYQKYRLDYERSAIDATDQAVRDILASEYLAEHEIERIET